MGGIRELVVVCVVVCRLLVEHSMDGWGRMDGGGMDRI
jgi:hypothetical protein